MNGLEGRVFVDSVVLQFESYFGGY